MEWNGDLADADWLATHLETDHERILDRFQEQLEASGNRLMQDEETLGQAMANAGQILRDVVASLRSGSVGAGEGLPPIAGGGELIRAAMDMPPGASLQSASLMFRTALDSVARALKDRPEAFGLIVAVTMALQQSIMARVRAAVADYTGFLLNQIHDAHVTERRRIARDLHDRVGHSISVTHRQLELFDMYSEVDSGRANQKVEAAQRAVLESMRHLRAFTSDLYEHHSLKSLENALRQYVDSGVGEGVHIRVRVDGDESRVAPEVVDETFLVLREAAHNALRHGDPSTIVINVDITPQELRAFVEDDGQGFDFHDAGDGFGICSMRERAGLLGGTLRLRSRTGKGTHVDLVVPLERRDTADAGW